jgi:hypothetical protein
MRSRIVVLASLLTALTVTVAPSVASAAPHRNRGLTINATPNPIVAGDGVLIYGQLNTPPVGSQTIVLYHHISGSHTGYTRIGSTTTNAAGFYEFTRAAGVVLTNRSWFARQDGIHGVHSRTVHERVAALVSLTANESTADTNHAIVFTGHVTPNHPFEPVLLQEQGGLTGNDWVTLKRGTLGVGSNFAIPYRWRRPGVRDVRVVFRGDTENIAGASDPVTVSIEQTQVADFTISVAPTDVIPDGSSLTISGILAKPGTTTTTPAPSTNVTLWGQTASQAYHAIATATTGTDGSYGFSLTGGLAPAHNEVYQVRTTLPPARHSAQLFEGVRDVVTISPSANGATVGGSVTFTGSVVPIKVGHAVYLQKLGADNDWHNVEVGVINVSSNYSFTWTFGTMGSKQFRVRTPGGPDNVGAVSPAETVSVTGLAPPSTLAPAS